jgi:hypothetical protein
VVELERPPLETVLQSLLDRGLNWSLERLEEEGVMHIRGKGVSQVLEALRPYRDEVWALTAPLLGQEAVWGAVEVEARRVPLKGRVSRVHLEPVFGLPLALRVEGERPLGRVAQALAYPAFYTLVLETQEGAVGWRSPYWWGELAGEAELRQAYPDLAEEVLRARKEGGAEVDLFGVKRRLLPGELLVYRLYGQKAV